MSALQIRRNVISYQRDTYLGHKPSLNPDYTPIDCAVGYSQWGVSSKAIAAHADANLYAISAYPEMFYDELLKPALQERFAAAKLEPSQIFFGHGSFNLAERLIHKLVQPTYMLGVGPQFNEIPSEFIGAGGSYGAVPYGGNDENATFFPEEELVASIIAMSPSMLYIDNPNNPQGSIVSHQTLRKLLAVAAERGTIVLVDEAYGDFVSDSHSGAHLVNQFPNLAVIRSFSKCLGLAAYRVGYMFLSRELAQYYSQLDVPFEPVLHGAIMAHATLEDHEFIERIRMTSAKSKAAVISALLGTGLYELLPTHPNTSIVAFRSRDPQRSIVQDMESLGIAVEPGEAFKRTCPHWDNRYCRVRIPANRLVDDFCRRIATLGEVKDVC